MNIQGFIGAIRARIILALSLLALLGIITFLSLSALLSSTSYRSGLWVWHERIVAGVNQLSWAAAEMYHSQDAPTREASLEKFKNAREQLAAPMADLPALYSENAIRGSRWQGGSPRLDLLADTLKLRLDSLLCHTDSLIAAYAASDSVLPVFAPQITQLSRGILSSSYLVSEEEGRLERLSQDKLKALGVGIILLYLALLLFVGLIVVSPMIRRLEKQMNYIVALSQNRDRLEQFIYATAHDLKEPLRSVSNFVQLLQRRYGRQLDESGNEYIEFAVKGVKRMYALLEDLSYYSKEGLRPLRVTVIDLPKMIGEVKEALDSKIYNHHARVEMILPLPMIEGDYHQLFLLFQNLIDNGIKYRKPDLDPIITIRGFEAQDYWQLEVEDNGIGIMPEHHVRIFDFYERVHNPEQVVEGTGMGLALCRRIIENHLGKIWVESAPGEGSRFRFRIARGLRLLAARSPETQAQELMS